MLIYINIYFFFFSIAENGGVDMRYQFLSHMDMYRYRLFYTYRADILLEYHRRTSLLCLITVLICGARSNFYE